MKTYKVNDKRAVQIRTTDFSTCLPNLQLPSKTGSAEKLVQICKASNIQPSRDPDSSDVVKKVDHLTRLVNDVRATLERDRLERMVGSEVIGPSGKPIYWGRKCMQ